jgi:hypothetical protein
MHPSTYRLPQENEPARKDLVDDAFDGGGKMQAVNSVRGFDLTCYNAIHYNTYRDKVVC